MSGEIKVLASLLIHIMLLNSDRTSEFSQSQLIYTGPLSSNTGEDPLIQFGCQELDLRHSPGRTSTNGLSTPSICPGENLNSGKRNRTENMEENW